MPSLKLLQIALEKQDYNLAAHVLVYGLVKTAKETEKDKTISGKKRQPACKPER